MGLALRIKLDRKSNYDEFDRGRSFVMDFGSFLMDFRRRVEVENRSKIDAKYDGIMLQNKDTILNEKSFGRQRKSPRPAEKGTDLAGGSAAEAGRV